MALLVFAVTLFIAVLISGRAERSVLSTSVLFLAAGFVAGPGVLGLIEADAGNPALPRFVQLALFAVLYTDGMRVDVDELVSAWHLPGRALLLGMPLTLVGTALLGHLLLGLAWPMAFLVGAVLSPTDPVLAAAIIGREEVPARLRHLLNVESGLNDGLALPVVLAMLALTGGREAGVAAVLGELALGVGLGILIPWVVIRLERSRFFDAAGLYEPLTAFAIGLLILAVSSVTHANALLAAFAGGIAVTWVSKEVCDTFRGFGELLAELLKLAALMMFGALVHPRYLGEIGAAGVAFVVLALIAARPAAIALALWRSELDWRERAVAAWFGPKGFSSVFFALLVLDSRVPDVHRVFHLLAVVIAASIVAHSSTDVPLAGWFRRAESERPEMRGETGIP